MLQQTVERVLQLKPKRVLVITNTLQVSETELQLAHYRSVPIDVVAEPCARNTAPAVALAAAIISAHDPTAVMAVLPADHFIRNETAFREALTSAAHVARNGFLATIGVVPTRPETGYGYIEADMALRGAGPFPVKRFVEKPPFEQAVQYVHDGRYFWNSGMFAWRTDTIIEEITNYMPELGTAMKSLGSMDDVWDLSDLQPAVDAMYSGLDSISIDYGVMEKSTRVQVVAAEMGWSDVGSWNALPEVVEAGNDGNIAVNLPGHIAIDSEECIIYGDGRLVATLGVRGLVIVSTADALLVCDRNRCQDVRKLVEKLKESGYERQL